ncbi:MAG: PfaD family polyunsaturated fatty acid/polyketide biosynthesis protein [Aphanocapsa lilacina HA4352-LM1]|jgi:PfaD family protein|nr:PfaD family polyunsaturated fatty acid/polyketide biosynthesis protein [Aphanocapsa lilacina HA4352-LM1]
MPISTTVCDTDVRHAGSAPKTGQVWSGPADAVAFDEPGIRSILRDSDVPCYAVRQQGRIGLARGGSWLRAAEEADLPEVLAFVPAMPLHSLGDPAFLAAHRVRCAYMTGAMANAIASEELVIAVGRAGMLGSFGAAGLVPDRIAAAIRRIQAALPEGPYAFNLIHSPSEPALEAGAVRVYLEGGVRTVEASAYIDLTTEIVHYRAAGLGLDPAGRIAVANRVIAKVSRREVAGRFLQPAPEALLRQLVEAGRLSPLQATLAGKVPMADDITVEADSGGHTDNRALVCLLPSILAQRDEIQAQQRFAQPTRIGAAGGIGTPQAVLAAFMMGAAYVVTGSVNQACVEAGTSAHTRALLARAETTDVTMAPAADMFELGVRLQVLKRETLFAMRAQKLYELYKTYGALEEIPAAEIQKLESQIFKKSLEQIWQETIAYFSHRDPQQIEKAEGNPRRKMALIFRWYLGLSSRWSNLGEKGREMDYQIWCGPSMGAFNDWVKGTYLGVPENRTVVDVAGQLMLGAAFLYRVQHLRSQGLQLPPAYCRYLPTR